MIQSNPAIIESDFDRLPPYSLEAERCVLASMMLDRECIPIVRAIVRRGAFYQADHQMVWDGICNVYDRTGNMDAILLREELKSCQLLDEVGGTAILGEILDSVPSSAHAEHYAGIVRDRHIWREGIGLANKLLRAAYLPHHDNSAAEQVRKIADAMVMTAVEGSHDGFRHIGEVAQQVYDSIESHKPKFIPSGVLSLDSIFGGLPIGGNTLIGARPMTGKSQLARQFAMNIAGGMTPDVVAIITVEEPDWKVAANCMAAMSGVKSRNIVHSCVSPEEFPSLAIGLTKVGMMKIYVNDTTCRLDEVRAAVALACVKYQAKVVIVDYLQLIDGGMENENREVTVISQALKSDFKRFGCVGISCVQLNRGNESGGVRLPMLKDLRGSGTLEQDGDLILLLHREDIYHKGEDHYQPNNKIDVIVAKNKYGNTGIVPLLWNGDMQTVADYPADSGGFE